MPYVDPQSIHNPSAGGIPPASWGDAVRGDLEFLIDPPACSIKESSSQSITSGTTTALTSNEENFDNDSMHSTSSNTSRITIVTAGRYLFMATHRWAANATGYRQIQFRVDGSTSYAMTTVQAVTEGSVETIISASKTLVLDAGQYVETMARHNTGSPLSVALDEFAAFFLTR